ncbi:MAG: pimeloyl-ACP methyl ester esterase BioH [Gammaproteobacteria bacterium]|nr:pimeloyl-ACP methyl ester esterase BioH [Gammaproteobacteria bacterium]
MSTDSSYKSDTVTLPNSPVVLLHGWGMNKNIWRPFIERLPLDIQSRIVTLDLPGFGDNDWIPAQYDLPSLTSWLDKQISEPCILLGWSLGGLVAQHYAINHPDKVARLGLIASSPKFMAEGDWHGIKPETLTMFSEQLMLNHEQTIERFLAIQAMGAKSARQDIKNIRDLVLQAPVPNLIALEQGLQLLQLVDLRTQFQYLSVPVVGLFGRLDALVPVGAVEAMQQLNPNAGLTVLNKASHAPFISHVDEFLTWFNKTVN